MPTGTIVSPTYTASSDSPGNGELAVKYDTAADANHPTQFSLIVGGVAGPWQNVLAYNSSSFITKLAQTYQIKFQRTTGTPSDTPPPTQAITVKEDQKLTLNVHYS